MSVKGLVWSMRQYLGSAQPPTTVLEDESRYGSDGAFRADGQPNWVRTPKGIWVLDFNPANPDYIEIPADQTQLDFTSENFSIITRINIDDLSGNPTIFCRGLSGSDGYYWLVDSSGRLNFTTNDPGADTTRSNSLIVINTAYTVGMSKIGTVVKLYINGAEVTYDLVDTHQPIITSARIARIGVYDNLGGGMDGLISALDIFSYALAPEQHAAIHYKLKQWG